jgi:hypothetical protein
MANYSSWDNQFQNCLNGKNPANVCIPHPSSFNPYNVTSLADFKIGMLVEILSNSLFGKKLGMCYEAVKNTTINLRRHQRDYSRSSVAQYLDSLSTQSRKHDLPI